MSPDQFSWFTKPNWFTTKPVWLDFKNDQFLIKIEANYYNKIFFFINFTDLLIFIGASFHTPRRYPRKGPNKGCTS
jgi:hypothetical protein